MINRPDPTPTEGFARSMRLQERSCPICGKSDPVPALAGRDTWRGRDSAIFQVVRCRSCGMAYTNPRPSPADLLEYFDGSYPFYRRSREGGPIDERRLVERLAPFLPRAERVARLAGKTGRLLDCGCGDGYFLTAMSRLGWEVQGLERDPAAAEHARSLGHNVVGGALEEAQLPQRGFDVITMWGMLQLSDDPRATIRRSADLLLPGGLLALGLSNFASLDRRLLRGRWWGLGLPRHLSHFEPRTIEALLRSEHYRVESIIMHAPRWVAFENANTLLGVRGAPGRASRVLRRAVAEILHAIELATRRTMFAPVMEIYARAQDLLR